MKEIVENLLKKNLTISTMESCTGGMLANSITNIPNASLVFKFGAVTYSNEYKIKLNVSQELIDTYSVYSVEVARDMSKKISDFTNSDIGIGVTGKLKRQDINNLVGEDDLVYYSIYLKKEDKYYTNSVIVTSYDREENKLMVINDIVNKLKEILK